MMIRVFGNGSSRSWAASEKHAPARYRRVKTHGALAQNLSTWLGEYDWLGISLPLLLRVFAEDLGLGTPFESSALADGVYNILAGLHLVRSSSG